MIEKIFFVVNIIFLYNLINLSCKNTDNIQDYLIRNLETICDKGFYLKGEDCFACYDNCTECNGIKCTECEYGFYPNEMNCFKCYQNCLECDGIQCTKCVKGYYPINMECYECYENCLECDGIKCHECIKGYYPNNMDCYKCYKNCLECDGTECSSCEEGYLPYKMSCFSGTKNSCNNDEGFYMFKKDYLELKNNNELMFICLTKENIGSGYFLNWEIENNKIFYFWDTCSVNCLECNGVEENNCLKCDEENYFQLYEDKSMQTNFKCFNKNQKLNYFIYEENSIKYLRKCNENCLTCINNSKDKCTSCDNENFFLKYEDIPNILNGVQCFSQIELPNYYLYKNQYFKECLGVCSTNECDKSCINCLVKDKYECLTCNMKENYYPLFLDYNETKGSFKCYLKDDFPHFFLNESDKTLVECSSSCKTCISNPTYCLSCSENAYYAQGFNDFKCYFNKPGVNWVLNYKTKEWQKCNDRCNTCFKQTNSDYDQQCTSCNISGKFYPYQKDVEAWNQGNNKYKLTGFNCYLKDEIFDDYFLDPNNLFWTKCSKSCSKCESNPDNCLVCNNNNEYYNIKYHKNGTCFKNPLPGYILDSEKEFNKCFRTCKYCQSTSNSFFYMQCKECDEKYYTLANNSYEKSYCIPKDNSSSLYLTDQLKWYVSGYNNSEHYKIYDYEVFNDKKYENFDFILTYKCPEDKPFIIYSIRQCVSKCSNPDDIFEYGLFFGNKLLYIYNNICYDECPYGSIPDNKSMTCIEENRYIFENLILKKEFDEYYQKNVDFYLAKCANNTIFQIQSSEFTNYFYNSSTNDSWKYQQSMPILELDNCISLLVEKYNYSRDEIHIGIFQNNDLKKEIYNVKLLSAINSTSFKIFLSNGTILNFSICNGMEINVKKQINMSLIENYEEALELLNNYNLSIFDTENDAFTDICIPLELGGKDISIYTRQNKLKSPIKLCDKGCNFLGIDYKNNYSLCKCQINNENEIGFGDLVKEIDVVDKTINLGQKSNIIIFKCLTKTKFDSKNYIFYITLILSIAHFILLSFYLIKFFKRIKLKFQTKENGNKFMATTIGDNKKNINSIKVISLYSHNKNDINNNINNTINFKNNENGKGFEDVFSSLHSNGISSNKIITYRKKKNNLYNSVPILTLKTINNNIEEENKNKFCKNFKIILFKNIIRKIPFERKLIFESSMLLGQILLFLLQSFLFWNGLLNTEEYITKRFDEKNKIGFYYILTNEFNKYFITSIIIIITLKIAAFFFNEIKLDKPEDLKNISNEKYIFRKKFKIILIEVIISVLNIFFLIFLYVFGNIYPNNKNLLLISASISIMFNLFILIITVLLSSLIMSLPYLCNCLNLFHNLINEIGNYVLEIF